MVQPVSIPDPAPSVPIDSITWAGGQVGWLPANLASFPAAAADVTTVNSSGTPQAFSLSCADVVRLSTPEGPFSTFRSRVGARRTWWFLRTPSTINHNWHVVYGHNSYARHGHLDVDHSNDHGLGTGVLRPAIIVHP